MEKNIQQKNIQLITTTSKKKTSNLTFSEEKLATSIARLLVSKKVYDILIINVTNICNFTDFFVIGTVDSDRQGKAASDEILSGIKKKHSIKPTYLNQSEFSWITIDYIDIVVHIFTKEKRLFYNLERLWGDGIFTPIENSEDSDT